MKKIIITSSSVLLFAVAVAVSSPEKTATAAASSEHKMYGPGDFKWGDAPPGLPAGAKMTVLDGDPGKAGSFTARLQTPAGYKIMPHTHPAPERVTVISGSVHLGMGDKFQEAGTKEFTAGSFVVLPAGMSHYVWKTSANAVVQIHSEGPFEIKYVNPADDPRNSKQ